MFKSSTTEEFIKKAMEVHGKKYDYSKVSYIKNSINVIIICPVHGEFLQTPASHLIGSECNKCSLIKRGLKRRKTTEFFIGKTKEIHGDKYDYSKVVYTGNDKNVIIICPEHGEFKQHPSNHVSGKGCSKCVVYPLSITTDDVIERSKEKHGDKYDYSKVVYKGPNTKITIICPEHGEFKQDPYKHMRETGCPKCNGGVKHNINDFLIKAKKKHGDRYDYSKVVYVNNTIKVTIICPEHGEFKQAPNKHYTYDGCPKCSGSYMDTEYFIENAKKVHGNKYDYSKVNYNKIKLTIICPEHGEFQQISTSHLRGSGCPKCNGRFKLFVI